MKLLIFDESNAIKSRTLRVGIINKGWQLSIIYPGSLFQAGKPSGC